MSAATTTARKSSETRAEAFDRDRMKLVMTVATRMKNGGANVLEAATTPNETGAILHHTRKCMARVVPVWCTLPLFPLAAVSGVDVLDDAILAEEMKTTGADSIHLKSFNVSKKVVKELVAQMPSEEDERFSLLAEMRTICTDAQKGNDCIRVVAMEKGKEKGEREKPHTEAVASTTWFKHEPIVRAIPWIIRNSNYLKYAGKGLLCINLGTGDDKLMVSRESVMIIRCAMDIDPFNLPDCGSAEAVEMFNTKVRQRIFALPVDGDVFHAVVQSGRVVDYVNPKGESVAVNLRCTVDIRKATRHFDAEHTAPIDHRYLVEPGDMAIDAVIALTTLLLGADHVPAPLAAYRKIASHQRPQVDLAKAAGDYTVKHYAPYDDDANTLEDVVEMVSKWAGMPWVMPSVEWKLKDGVVKTILLPCAKAYEAPLYNLYLSCYGPQDGKSYAAKDSSDITFELKELFKTFSKLCCNEPVSYALVRNAIKGTGAKAKGGTKKKKKAAAAAAAAMDAAADVETITDAAGRAFRASNATNDGLAKLLKSLEGVDFAKLQRDVEAIKAKLLLDDDADDDEEEDDEEDDEDDEDEDEDDEDEDEDEEDEDEEPPAKKAQKRSLPAESARSKKARK
jgi:hypothetical protein